MVQTRRDGLPDFRGDPCRIILPRMDPVPERKLCGEVIIFIGYTIPALFREQHCQRKYLITDICGCLCALPYLDQLQERCTRNKWLTSYQTVTIMKSNRMVTLT